MLEQLLKKEKNNLDEKFKILDLLRDSFQFFSKSNSNIPQVIFFEGQEGLKKIYLSMMDAAGTIKIHFISLAGCSVQK